jgi:DNA invertase Pin-like site-specific DNA recombinase
LALIGYARVSTDDQVTDAQMDDLRAAGRARIFDERASGGSRARSELIKALDHVRPGDTLIIWKLDRLARSLSHLLEIIERLQTVGAHFRCLSSPIDTSSPHGTLILQILGAVAEYERGLIQERTKAGLRAAAKRNRIGGNPALKRKDPEAIRAQARRRDAAYFAKLNVNAEEWLPAVRRLRPDHAWQTVARAVNAKLPKGRHWSEERLRRAVRRFVQDGLLDTGVLGRASRAGSDTHLITLVAGMKRANPSLSLRKLGAQLEAMRELTPRGNSKWSAPSVKNLLERAKAWGLLDAT